MTAEISTQLSTYVSEPVTISARPSRAAADLERRGFVHLREQDSESTDRGLRSYLLKTYFNAGFLRSDLPDVPPDRERARDVVYYQWRPVAQASSAAEGLTDSSERSASNQIRLVGNAVTAIVDRDGRPGTRDYARLPFVADPRAAAWVASILSLLPSETRQREGGRGTFGINLFRTHTQVVTRPHRDDEEYVIVYVIDKLGGGAETELFEEKTGERVYSAVLQPGELIIFKDAAFLHNATPLVPLPDGTAPRRDALVCTVNYPWTYPLKRDLWAPNIATRLLPAPRRKTTVQVYRAKQPR